MIKQKILADASDYVLGWRPGEDQLNSEEIQKKRFHRLGELVDKFVDKAALNTELFRDLVVQVATDMHITGSKSGLQKLQGMMLWHQHEPINVWFAKQLKTAQ